MSDPSIKNIPYSFAKQHGVLLTHSTEPNLNGSMLTIFYQQQTSGKILIELARFFAQPLTYKQIGADEFNHRLTQIYQAEAGTASAVALDLQQGMDLGELLHDLPKTEDLLESQDDAPVIKLLNAILTQAIKSKASDIHVETFEQAIVIRFRVDGLLKEIIQLPRALAPLIISRLKVMAKLDIAEKRQPQDGRISLSIAGHTIDVRVSTLPASHAERVVLRLLDKKNAMLDLGRLGMHSDDLKKMRQLIAHPHGIILVTGPTGSGKTTSLYAMLTELNQQTRNILTVEDPIEYNLPGIGQTQVNPKVQMTFAKGLRAILRQDPDIVMVGEIRDRETAEIAVQASLTGHLVLSTLHTNTAIGAITRLRDMGIDAYLLASSLVGIIAQRLVRLLCPKCKTPLEANSLFQNAHGYKPTGCVACENLGFKGRSGIYEIISVDTTLQKMIHEDCNEPSLETYCRQTMPSIRQDGIRRVMNGETTLDEIMRVTRED